MILDLGFDVTNIRVQPMFEGLGANLKAGYTGNDTNADFGVDAFNSETYFDTPLRDYKGVMDISLGDVLTEQYAIEKMRQQQVKQPVGATYKPNSPSKSNKSVALYCKSSPTTWIGTDSFPNPDYPNVRAYRPDNTQIGVGTPSTLEVYQLNQRPTAQSIDPTAAADPYIYGMYYPESAYNVEISPCRNLQRYSGWLHSVLDNMDSDYLSFRNTYIMQYNNQVSGLSGIESNLTAFQPVVTEFKDIVISDLQPQLFRPIILSFRSKYPVNMYSIIAGNSRGYIRFFERRQDYTIKEYKGFIKRVTQSAGTWAPTEFELWATPDFVL